MKRNEMQEEWLPQAKNCLSRSNQPMPIAYGIDWDRMSISLTFKYEGLV